MKYILLLPVIAMANMSWSQLVKKTVSAQRVDPSHELILDGRLDETFWSTLTWTGNFTQFRPSEDKSPAQQSEFAIAYDDNFIYVGFKAWDSAPDSIVQRLTRRDDVDGDLFGIQFDSYNDQRTAFSFVTSAAGVKLDFMVSNDGENEDNSWDPIWWVKTSRDGQGWYGEMKIPLTQLRFENSVSQSWGVQVLRNIFRFEELSAWQPATRKLSTWVSQFGTLDALNNLKPRLPLEIAPYVVARTDRFSKVEGDPFQDKGYRNTLNAGVDGKVGISNNFTLDFSVNPDFGQVEADPSQVNLTAQEVYFQERRPLFVEGKNIFSMPLMFGDGDLSSQNLFYSRRIGRSPHHYPALGGGEYLRQPDFTSILGAAKLSGKTQNGWSLGILETVTAQEEALIRTGEGQERKEVIEPLTNFFVSRVQKDYDQGNTLIGGMFTAVNRQLQQNHLNFLPQAAYSGGLDFVRRWKNRTYEFNLSLFYSQVQGSATAIDNVQNNFVHLFQRPDQTYKPHDPSRTKLLGHGGKAVLGKFSGKVRFLGAVAWQSPGFEINDAGFLPQADNVLEVIWVGYRKLEPFSIFRNFNLNMNQWYSTNFGGENMGLGGNFNMHMQFKNYWFLSSGMNYNGQGLDPTDLRGGPALLNPGRWNYWGFVGTNEQKKLRLNLEGGFSWSPEQSYRHSQRMEMQLSYRPSKTLNLSLSTNYNHNQTELQYVSQQETDGGTRYIFGSIDQRVLGLSLRVNYNLTPDLTIQYWGQPFVATGNYDQFKYITDPRAELYQNRFRVFEPNEIELRDDQFAVHENHGNNYQYAFGVPDFDVKEFLSNLVLRWEYRPGSTVFLVWSQNRNGFEQEGLFELRRDLGRIFDIRPTNIFMVKLAYRFGR